MLAKKYRLPIAQFLDKKAEVKRSQYFTIKTFETELPYSRFGIIVSKKVVAKATARNSIKRLIFSRCFPNIGAPRDVLIIVQKGAIIDELLWAHSSISF